MVKKNMIELGQEIYNLIDEFFKENKEGIVTLCYFEPLWEVNKYGMSFEKQTFKNENKLQWKNNGLLMRETLGFSLITGKHIYLPYHKIDKILFEDKP